MHLFKPLIKLGAMACAAVILSSCTVVVDEGPDRPRPPRPDRPQMCTMEYDPVCARRGERQRTFSNACMARAEGYRPMYPGECRRRPDRPPQSDRPQFCTKEYRPVCARRGDRVRTFPNACTARVADYRVIHPGSC